MVVQGGRMRQEKHKFKTNLGSKKKNESQKQKKEEEGRKEGRKEERKEKKYWPRKLPEPKALWHWWCL